MPFVKGQPQHRSAGRKRPVSKTRLKVTGTKISRRRQQEEVKVDELLDPRVEASGDDDDDNDDNNDDDDDDQYDDEDEDDNEDNNDDDEEDWQRSCQRKTIDDGGERILRFGLCQSRGSSSRRESLVRERVSLSS
jgi:hypothetical protein